MNKENSETYETQKFVPNLLQRLDLISLNKHVSLQNPSISWFLKGYRIPPSHKILSPPK